MNLAAYDKIRKPTRSYYNRHNKTIMTKDVIYREFYTYVTKYNVDTKQVEIYLVITDDNVKDRQMFKTRISNWGYVIVSIGPIIDIIPPINVRPDSTPVYLTKVEEKADGEIYLLEVN